MTFDVRMRSFSVWNCASRDFGARSPKCKVLFLSRVQKQHSVLMSVIAGEAVAAVKSLEDKQVLQQCMATLRELFKEQVRHPSLKRERLTA